MLALAKVRLGLAGVAHRGVALGRFVCSRPQFENARPSVPSVAAMRMGLPRVGLQTGSDASRYEVASLCGGGGRSPLRFYAGQQHVVGAQVRGMADGGGRWDKDSDRASGEDKSGAGGVKRNVDPLHPHGLNISVFNGNVDLAMRKLRRKVIVEGIMKKFKKNRV